MIADTMPWRCYFAPSIAAVVLVGLGLSTSVAACSLDGFDGPSHGGFGAWGQLMANRHAMQRQPSAGNFDSGVSDSNASDRSGSSNAQEIEAENSGQLYNTLPSPSVEVRESGGSVRVKQISDEEPIDLQAQR